MVGSKFNGVFEVHIVGNNLGQTMSNPWEYYGQAESKNGPMHEAARALFLHPNAAKKGGKEGVIFTWKSFDDLFGSRDRILKFLSEESLKNLLLNSFNLTPSQVIEEVYACKTPGDILLESKIDKAINENPVLATLSITAPCLWWEDTIADSGSETVHGSCSDKLKSSIASLLSQIKTKLTAPRKSGLEALKFVFRDPKNLKEPFYLYLPAWLAVLDNGLTNYIKQTGRTNEKRADVAADVFEYKTSRISTFLVHAMMDFLRFMIPTVSDAIGKVDTNWAYVQDKMKTFYAQNARKNQIMAELYVQGTSGAPTIIGLQEANSDLRRETALSGFDGTDDGRLDGSAFLYWHGLSKVAFSPKKVPKPVINTEILMKYQTTGMDSQTVSVCESALKMDKETDNTIGKKCSLAENYRQLDAGTGKNDFAMELLQMKDGEYCVRILAISAHADGSGVSAIPTLQSIIEYAKDAFKNGEPGYVVLLMDANTSFNEDQIGKFGKLNAHAFLKELTNMEMHQEVRFVDYYPKNGAHTTRKTRTSLQVQGQKAELVAADSSDWIVIIGLNNAKRITDCVYEQGSFGPDYDEKAVGGINLADHVILRLKCTFYGRKTM